jgi:DNA topoisomerase I
MKNLLIVESPAKIKTISKFLGKDFKIMSTVGHIKDLPQKELGVSINKTVDIHYVTLEGKEKTIAEICREASKADHIYLAPDPDREGEIIAWHVEQEVGRVVKDKSKIKRITFNEITKPAIEEALSHPSDVNLDKVSAQQARRVLDRLVGYEVSPILWKKIAKGLSAGRVQSVALKLIVDREEAIKNFKQEEYWSIEALFSGEGGSFTAPLTHISKKKAEIANEKDATTLVEKIQQASYAIESIKESKRLKNPNAPFMTSTMQQSAYNQLGFSVQRTMQLAQKLYEGVPLEDASTPVALITYMRTDSLRISETALSSARSFIQKAYGKDYLPTSANLYSKAKGQDAHEAIRPIDVTFTPEKVTKYMPADMAKLYDLIWRRFVASQVKPAQYAQRQVTVQGGPYTFKATGSTLLFDGFLKVYGAEEEEKEEETGKTTIPKNLKEKDPLDIKKITPKQHFTQPPPRYTEATLVKELEKEGIGRPSTYVAILRTIQARAYTHLDDKKRFVPSELGMVVTKMLTENLPKIMDLKFTASMEESLDKIAQGNLSRDVVIKDFYHDFEKDLETFRGEAKKAIEKTEIICPECKEGHLLIRFGKAGPFVGCERYPQCKFTSNFERQLEGAIKLVKQEGPKVLEEACPLCEKPLRQMVGRFGPFIACTGYPGCKYIKQNKAKFKCTQCGKGDVVQKIWKGKKFWGCGTYPECNFSISGEIEETPCSQCNAPYLLRRVDKAGNITLICNNKSCGFKKSGEPETSETAH